MAPSMACPNCGQREWLESPHLGYLPRVARAPGGGYEADAGRGIHARVWRCNNCMYLAAFWEPD